MEELEQRDFKLGEWMDRFPLKPYDRDASYLTGPERKA